MKRGLLRIGRVLCSSLIFVHTPMLVPQVRAEEPSASPALAGIQGELDPQLNPYNFSFGQKFAQAMGSATVGSIGVYPIFALYLDAQSGKPISLNPIHLSRGFGGGMGKILPNVAVTTVVGELYMQMRKSDDEPGFAESFASSSVAGTMAALSSIPFELMATRQRNNEWNGKQFFDDIKKNGGYIELYRGSKATIARDVVFAFGILSLPKLIQGNLDDSEESHVRDAAIAAGSGAAVGIISLPFDAARGHIQRMPAGQSTPGVIASMNEIIKKDGVAGLFKGAPFRAVFVGSIGLFIGAATSVIQDYQAKGNAEEIAKKHPEVNPETILATAKNNRKNPAPPASTLAESQEKLKEKDPLSIKIAKVHQDNLSSHNPSNGPRIRNQYLLNRTADLQEKVRVFREKLIGGPIQTSYSSKPMLLQDSSKSKSTETL